VSMDLIVIGAGGHARVCADLLLLTGRRLIGFTDCDELRRATQVYGIDVLGTDRVLESYSPATVMLVNGIGSVGDPKQRRGAHERLSAAGWSFETLVHPSAIVSTRASLSQGAQVMAGAVVQAGAQLGIGCIVNTRASIDHDCVIGAHTHIAPGATLSGGVRIGESCHVGTGAVLIQGVSLGDGTVVAAGAVVTRSHAGNSLLMGVPARARGRQ
jgi:sugar O-acyltransferase (sialic acid O-acetyltransferase NeuD family)